MTGDLSEELVPESPLRASALLVNSVSLHIQTSYCFGLACSCSLRLSVKYEKAAVLNAAK